VGIALARFIVAGVGGRRNDALPIGMTLAKAPDHLPQKMNLADADAMKPDDRFGFHGRQKRMRDAARELGEEAPAIFAGGEGLVKKPRGSEDKGEQIEDIEQVRHGNPFPALSSFSDRFEPSMLCVCSSER